MRTAVITGGTSGIGLELAEQLKSDFDRVVVVGRSRMPPQHVAERGFEYCGADLAESGAPRTVAAALCGSLGVDRIDLLVLCAGVGWVGELRSQSARNIEELVQVNLISPILLTRLLFPLLLCAAARGGTPRVCFVGSVVVHLPAPRYAVYAATKAALDAFAVSLDAEEAGRVRALVVHVGATRTGFHSRAGYTGPTDRFASPAATAAVLRSLALGGTWGAQTSTPGLAGLVLSNAARLSPSMVDWAFWLSAPSSSAPGAGAAAKASAGRDGTGAAGTVVVTGAARGLGLELALLARERVPGCRVVCVDRLPIPDGVADVAVRADLATAEGVVTALAAARGASLVFHNAGVNRSGRFAECDPAEQESVLRTNLLAPMLLVAGVPEARVVLVSSLAAYTTYPFSAVYAASKAGLQHFGRSLGQSAIVVCPGAMDTEQARENSPDNARRKSSRTPPATIARRVWNRSIPWRSGVFIPTWPESGVAVVARVFPWVFSKVMARLFEPKGPGREQG